MATAVAGKGAVVDVWKRQCRHGEWGSEKQLYTTDRDTRLRQFRDKGDRKLDYTGLSEIEQIHQENIEILARMSAGERDEAKQELLDNLDPKVLQMLMRRSAKKYGPPGADEPEKDPLYEPVEGSMGTWVGENTSSTGNSRRRSRTKSWTKRAACPMAR